MNNPTLPDLTLFETYHGIQVSLIGEDGDVYVALGHHEPKNALAAFNTYAQRTVGLEDLTDGSARHDRQYWQNLLLAVQQRWAVLLEHCAEFDSPDHDEDCFRCREIKEAGWWMTWSDIDRDTPGAFPITKLSLA